MDELAINGGPPASSKMIPVAKPFISEKAISDVSQVLRSGQLRQGDKVREFEERFQVRVGARHAYAVSSGTAALHTAYLSTLHPGDEVIVPALSFIASASTVIHVGGKTVFADVDPSTFLIDVDDVQEKISMHTKILAPVHLFGNSAEMSAIADMAEDSDLVVVGDCAQAHGTEYRGADVGSFETMNCFSFYPTKTMTTGEGGMVTTNNDQLCDKGKLLRDHGADSKYHHILLGHNYRMTEMAAVIGLNQLDGLDESLEKRRRIGEVLRDGVESIDGLRPQRINDHVSPSYSYFSVVMEVETFSCARDVLLKALRAENIDCTVHYPVPLTQQPAITDLIETDSCPVTEEISRSIFSLPMHPFLTDEDVGSILAGVEKVASHYLKR